MLFASQVKKQVEIGGETFHIRKLSWRSLAKAREAHQIASAAPLRAYGGELMKALRSDAVEEAAASLAAKRATAEGRAKERYDQYDQEGVLGAGIESWSLPVLLSPAAIDDLEEEAAQALHRAILDLSLPPIDPDDAAPKGDTSPSGSY